MGPQSRGSPNFRNSHLGVLGIVVTYFQFFQTYAYYTFFWAFLKILENTSFWAPSKNTRISYVTTMVLGQNDIWVLVLWPGTEYTIRGKVVASPKFGLWWVLWIRVYSWLVRAPKCSNYALTNLLFGFCRSVWVIELLVNLPSPHPKALAHPSTPKVLRARECAPTPSLFDVFTFGLVVESIKEPRGASIVKDNLDFYYVQYIAIMVYYCVPTIRTLRK
jgi:hypothetical protein